MSISFKHTFGKKSTFLIYPIMLFFLIGCGGSSEKENTQDYEEITLDEEITRVDIAKEDFSRMLETLPDPTKIPVLLENTGSEFDQSLLNPASRVQDYMTTNNKAALNIGVFSADLGYLCAYVKAQEAITYLKTTQRLVEHLGLSSAVQTSLMKRFEANLSQRDSLIKIVNQSVDLAQDFLSESERFNTAALIAAGSFIEGLYISTSLVENYPKDLPEARRKALLEGLVKTILEQKKPLGDLVSVLDVLGNSDPDVARVKEQVSDLFDIYDIIGIEEKMKKNPDELLTDKTLTEITAKVKEIRMQFIE
jgi:hypothetical protein